MPSWIKGSAITLIGIAALWYVATRPLATLDAAPAVLAKAPAIEGALPAVADIEAYEPARDSATSNRNPFGYVVAPPPQIVAPPMVVPPVIVAPPAVVSVTPSEPPPPRFAYRFIGRFGPERDPVAAFAANGEVITVRRGDRIGDRFVLRTIGIESVEVADGERIVRVPME